MIKEGLFSHSKIDEDLKAEVSSAKVEEIIRGFALGRGSSFDDVDLEQIRLDHSIGLYLKVETMEFLKGIFDRVIEGRFADEDLEYILLRARNRSHEAIVNWFHMASRWKWRAGFEAGGILDVWAYDRYLQVKLSQPLKALACSEGVQARDVEGEPIEFELYEVHSYSNPEGIKRLISPCGETNLDFCEANLNLNIWMKENPLILDGRNHRWLRPEGYDCHLLEPMQAGIHAAYISLADLGVRGAQFRTWLD